MATEEKIKTFKGPDGNMYLLKPDGKIELMPGQESPKRKLTDEAIKRALKRFGKDKKKGINVYDQYKNKKEPQTLEAAKGGIVKKFKGGLMVKPKAAKRGY